MRIDFKGKLVDEPEIRAGFIGCGSHSFRNLYPDLPVRAGEAGGDLRPGHWRRPGLRRQVRRRARLRRPSRDARAARSSTRSSSAPATTTPAGRTYPRLAVDCLEAGRHVWMEKPPAASCAEIERMQAAAARGRQDRHGRPQEDVLPRQREGQGADVRAGLRSGRRWSCSNTRSTCRRVEEFEPLPAGGERNAPSSASSTTCVTRRRS